MPLGNLSDDEGVRKDFRAWFKRGMGVRVSVSRVGDKKRHLILSLLGGFAVLCFACIYHVIVLLLLGVATATLDEMEYRKAQNPPIHTLVFWGGYSIFFKYTKLNIVLSVVQVCIDYVHAAITYRGWDGVFPVVFCLDFGTPSDFGCFSPVCFSLSKLRACLAWLCLDFLFGFGPSCFVRVGT